MSEAVADVLDDAADLIERHGWRQGVGPAGACLVTALYRAAGSDATTGMRGALHNAADAAVADMIGDPTALLFPWNDEPGRTEQEVLDALRAAAKQQRHHP